MAHAAGDAHAYPIYAGHFRITFGIYNGSGDLVTGAAGLDSEVSKDAGAFADCTNEATEIGSTGVYYLDLTGLEMTAKQVCVQIKTSTVGAKTTLYPMIYPIRLPVLESGTAQAGAAGTITLASGASAVDDFYNGCLVYISNNGAAGSQYQVRRIIDYVGSTKVATIDSNWGTNPSSASTYDILPPEGYATVQWGGGKVGDPATAGIPSVNVVRVGNTAQTAGDIVALITTLTGYVDTEVAAILAAVDTEVAAIKTQTDQLQFVSNRVVAYLDASGLQTDAVNELADGLLGRSLAAESYAADGALATVSQMFHMLWSRIAQFDITGTTLTSRKLNGTDAAMTFSLDDATAPTSITRAT